MTTKVIAKCALAAAATFGFGLPAHAGLIMDVAGGLLCPPNGSSGLVDCGPAAGPSGPALPPAGTTQHIEWFNNGNPRSELNTTLTNNLLLTSPGPASVFQMVTQTNRIIPSAGTWNLDGALNLTFQDHQNPGPVIHNDTLGINVDFIETLNTGNCPVGNPNNTICDDRYLLTLNKLALEMFMTDTTIYNVRFGLEAGNGTTIFTRTAFVPGECLECSTLGDNQFIVFTAEQNITSVNFTVDVIKTNKVSEPSALALVGLGLLGFGLSRRRARKS